MAALPASEHLWLTEPRRKTCLAEVVERSGSAFRVDRALFRPKSRGYRHPQRADQGTVWVQGGDKHVLTTAFWRGRRVWYRIDGDAPSVGAQLQCHLDQDRRELDSRCHTAMHLLLAAMGTDGPPLAADPEVKGGGRFRLDLRTWQLDPNELAAWLEHVNAWIEQDRQVSRSYVPRDATSHAVEEQPFEQGERIPGPDGSIEVVEIDGVCTLPCDGTHADRTSELGRVVMRDLVNKGDGTVVVIGEVPRDP